MSNPRSRVKPKRLGATRPCWKGAPTSSNTGPAGNFWLTTREGRVGRSDILVALSEKVQVPDFIANCVAPHRSHPAATVGQVGREHRVHDRAIAERLPVQPIGDIERDFVFVLLPTL